MKTTFVLTAISLALTITSAATGREWTDSTGAFKVNAELVGVSGDAVQLRKPDGSIIAVPMARLSDADQRFVRSRSSAGGRQSSADADPAGRIHKALASPTELDFFETPIEQVFAYLMDRHRIWILIDRRAWNDAGIETNVPVTRKMKGMSLAESLDIVLKELNLTWVIRDDVLLVTTPTEAESQLEATVYRLKKPQNFDELIQNITRDIEPNRWRAVGGPGDLAPFPPSVLVVSQPQAVQYKIQKRYADSLQAVSPTGPIAIPTLKGKPLGDALNGNVNMEFMETPLRDVVAFLSAQTRVTITVDQQSLDGVGIAADCPVTINLRGIRLRSALSHLVRPLGLAWTIDGDAVRITTPDVAAAKLEQISYPAGDLPAGADLALLVRLVEKIVAPQSWNSVGGPGSIRAEAQGTLVVRQTFEVHEQVCRLLAGLREATKP